MNPKDADGIANRVDPDQTALIWVCTGPKNKLFIVSSYATNPKKIALPKNIFS